MKNKKQNPNKLIKLLNFKKLSISQNKKTKIKLKRSMNFNFQNDQKDKKRFVVKSLN